MSGGDEQPDEAADEPADRSSDEPDDAAADGADEPVDDADRDRPDSPHRDPRTADDDGDEADSDGEETDSDGNQTADVDTDADADADSDEEATPGVGSGGSTDDADSSSEPANAPPDDADADADDGDEGMPNWEEKQWGPREDDEDGEGGEEVEDERPYDPAFDDATSDNTVSTVDLDDDDDGGTDDDSESAADDDSVDSHGDDGADSHGDDGADSHGDDGESSADDADDGGNIVAVDQDADELTPEEGAASDGGTVSVGEDNTIGGAADEYGGSFGGFRDGPEYDQEMPLADHIEEMMTRLLTVIVVMAVVSAPAFLFADTIIQYVWDSILGAAGSEAKPHVYRPLSLVLARLKTATLAGFIIALPVFVYETYRFMRPGLYPKERRYYLAAVPTSLVLASVGVLFAFYLVLPAIFVYFVTYSKGAAVIAFGLTDTYGLMLTMMGFFALIFQIPLFIMLAIMMGLTTRKWLADRRILFWGAFAGLSALFAFDPTGMAPIIVALTMIVLFEGTLFMLRWVERGKAFFARGDGDADSDA